MNTRLIRFRRMIELLNHKNLKQPVFKTAIASMMLLAIASCHNVHEVPFPEELSEPPQPKTVPLEFTDPISAHWDTLGKADFNPAIFHCGF